MAGKSDYIRLGKLISRLKAISPETTDYIRLSGHSLAAMNERGALGAANDFVIEMFGIPSEYKQQLARVEDYERIALRKIGEWKSLRDQIIEMLKIINPRLGTELNNDAERAKKYLDETPKNLSKNEFMNYRINVYKQYVEDVNVLFASYYSRLST